MRGSDATEKQKTWQKRLTDWWPRILIGGASGFAGTVLSAISEMDKFPPALSDFKHGSKFVMLGWGLATAIVFGATLVICKVKISNARDKHIDESKPGN
jgi:hypothetical protein